LLEETIDVPELTIVFTELFRTPLYTLPSLEAARSSPRQLSGRTSLENLTVTLTR
jgi:hypothetical protein